MHSVQRIGLSFAILLLAAGSAGAQHRLVIQGNDRLAILDQTGRIEWEMPWKAIHDIHVLDNGQIFVQQGAAKVVEIDTDSKEIVWSYDSATQNGYAGQPVEVHSFQPLENGCLLIAEPGVPG